MDVPGFIAAQAVGAIAAFVVFAWLMPAANPGPAAPLLSPSISDRRHGSG
jgi:hypothetical protein